MATEARKEVVELVVDAGERMDVCKAPLRLKMRGGPSIVVAQHARDAQITVKLACGAADVFVGSVSVPDVTVTTTAEGTTLEVESVKGTLLKSYTGTKLDLGQVITVDAEGWINLPDVTPFKDLRDNPPPSAK